MYEKRGKDGLTRLLLFLLGLLAGLAVCAWAVTTISSLQMKKMGYVPLTPVMKAAGYEKGDSQGDAFCYLRDNPRIELRLSPDYSSLTKNGYSYDARGRFSSSLHTLYAEKAYIEDVLDVQLEKTSVIKTGKTELPWFIGKYTAVPTMTKLEEWGWEGAPLIAHAGGGIVYRNESGQREILTYTNSLEAIQSNYEKGFRVFEIDFNLTTDGYLVAAHNWNNQYGEQKSLADFTKNGIREDLTSMTLDDVMEQLHVNQDMILVLDIKSYQWSEEEILDRYQTIHDTALIHGGQSTLDRIVPQIYQRSEYDLIKQVYSWKNIIYTLYRDKDIPEEDVLAFARDKEDLPIITLPKSRVNAAFSQTLHAIGKKVCVYTINDLDHLPEWLNQGVDWFCTDTMTPDGWRSLYA